MSVCVRTHIFLAQVLKDESPLSNWGCRVFLLFSVKAVKAAFHFSQAGGVTVVWFYSPLLWISFTYREISVHEINHVSVGTPLANLILDGGCRRVWCSGQTFTAEL